MKKLALLLIAAGGMLLLAPQSGNAIISQLSNEEAVTILDKNFQQDEDYEEIDASDLPDAVTESFEKMYTDFSIEKAFVSGDEESYKLEINKEDRTILAYFKSNGDYIQQEVPENK
ncbi:MAG: hypothetical protein ACQER7_13935 [Bacteroidota bacterium]